MSLLGVEKVWGGLGFGWLFAGVEGCFPFSPPPNQSIKRLYSPCQGELVGRVMGQREIGLRENIQLSFSE